MTPSRSTWSGSDGAGNAAKPGEQAAAGDWFLPDDVYAIIERSMPIPSMEALITMDGKLLLMRRKNRPAKGEWWFCGGRIHRGEDMMDCLRREVREETSLDVIIDGFVGVFNRIFPDRHDISIVYRCSCAPGSRVTMDGEHSEWDFFDKLPDGLHPFLLDTIERSGWKPPSSGKET